MSEDNDDYDALKACLTCCAVCCWSIFLTITISANVVGFVGLSRTRLIDLEPYCPHNYWEGSLTLIFLRVLVFSMATSIVACSKQMAEHGIQAGCVCCAVLVSLVFALSITITDTVITSQAISALNCSVALRNHERDSDPLLIVSGSCFVALDWVFCIAICCMCMQRNRESDKVVVYSTTS